MSVLLFRNSFRRKTLTMPASSPGKNGKKRGKNGKKGRMVRNVVVLVDMLSGQKRPLGSVMEGRIAKHRFGKDFQPAHKTWWSWMYSRSITDTRVT